MGDMLLDARNLSCVRGGRVLFEGLGLSVEAGDALFVEGPNGSGKSSLLRLLASLLQPDAGTVTRHVRTAYVGHENALKGNRSLGEELGWWARLDQAPDLQGAIAAMGLTGLEAVPVRVLSAGQKRRATLARAIASGSRLWLLDEPGAGLDAASVERLEQAIARHREAGGAAVIASHGETRVAGARTLSL